MARLRVTPSVAATLDHASPLSLSLALHCEDGTTVIVRAYGEKHLRHASEVVAIRLGPSGTAHQVELQVNGRANIASDDVLRVDLGDSTGIVAPPKLLSKPPPPPSSTKYAQSGERSKRALRRPLFF
jgi:hypothetical protein